MKKLKVTNDTPDSIYIATSYLQTIIDGRLKVYFGKAKEVEINGTAFHNDESNFSHFILI